MHLFTPASVDEAIDLLTTSAMPVDSPTQRRLRTVEHLHDTFGSGRRRPAWVWALRDGADGPPLGVVAALGSAYDADEQRAFVLDHFGLPDDPELAHRLLGAATDAALSVGVEEAGIFAPTDHGVDSPELLALTEPLRAAGWRLLVERRHYEFEPTPDAGEAHPTELTFEQLTDPGDPRLAQVHRELMRETLDAHDQALVERLGFEEACRESLAFLLDADPVDRIHLAHDPSGTPVGIVSGLVVPSGRAFVLFVGVAHDHRGHGYGRELLAWQTRRLLAGGALTLIADTDHANVPMA
ncbi:MAG: GNAT family N-acetyltransferase, partial [Nocardioides sp.]